MLTRQNSVLRLTTQITTMGLICLFVDCQLAKADEPENLNDPGKPSARVTTNSVLEQQPLVPELNWSEADSKSKWQIVALLADHMRSNFDKIRTWRGKYHVRSIEPQRESFLRSAFAGRVDGRDLSDVTLEREFRIEFAFDAQSRNIYRAKISDLMYWRDRKKDEQFIIPNTAPADERSYVAGEEYVHFDPLVKWPEFNHLLDNPEAMQKRAAFRASSQSATRMHYGDMLDPIVFFGHDQDSRLWETMSVCLNAHEGKAGGEQQKKAEEAVKCSQADGPRGKFYRFDFNIQMTDKNSTKSTLYSSWILDGNQEFHPVSFFMHRGDEKNVIRQMKWRWRHESDVFVPDVVLDVFSDTAPNGMNLWRECELENSSVNEPLDPDLFTPQGLGLKDGELIIDEIERSVKMLRDGKVVQIGNFGDQYVAPQQPTNQFTVRYIMLSINALALLAFLVILARRRNR